MANTGGDITKRVNAQKYEVFIATVSNEFLYLQEADLGLIHSETIEPTSAGTNVPYSGNPRHSLTGTILFSTTDWAAATAGWTALTTRTNNEYPIFTLIVRETAADGSTSTKTFTSGAKVQEHHERRGKEGGVTVSFNFVMWVDPTIS